MDSEEEYQGIEGRLIGEFTSVLPRGSCAYLIDLPPLRLQGIKASAYQVVRSGLRGSECG